MGSSQKIDLYYITKGEEFVQVSNFDKMEAENDCQEDYQLFNGGPKQKILLKVGDFVLLYSHEVHETSIISKTKEFVEKYVFKIPLLVGKSTNTN